VQLGARWEPPPAHDLADLVHRLAGLPALAVDCYCGGGAVLAAKATGRRWLATERDEATAVLARERLARVPRKPGE
jgi:hypothetical protein